MLSQPLWCSSFAHPYRRCSVLNSRRYTYLFFSSYSSSVNGGNDRSKFVLFPCKWFCCRSYLVRFSLGLVKVVQSIRLCCLPVLHSMKIGFFWSNVFVGLFCFWTSFLYPKSKSLWIRNDPFFLIISFPQIRSGWKLDELWENCYDLTKYIPFSSFENFGINHILENNTNFVCMICVLCDANRVRRSSVDKSGSKKMNHCNLQQNAFMSPHDESRGFVVPVSSVVCPKPRRVSILSNNVIHPCRSHSRYLKAYFFCLFFPTMIIF